MRRRHLRGVLRIENQVYPRPWSLGLFMSELAMRTGRDLSGRPGRPDRRRLRGAVVQPRRRTRHDHRGRPAVAPLQDRYTPAGPSRPTFDRRRRQEPHPRGPGEQRGRAGDVPPVRLRACRRAQGLLRRDQRGCDRDVGPRRQHRPSTPSGWRRSSARSRARTIVEMRSERSTATGTCILGIETSCDETAAAIVVRGTDVRSSVVSSQVDLHARYGGVVPEIASRAHVELLTPVVAEAVVEAGVEESSIEAVAATVGPGLVGSLLVGRERGQVARLRVGRALRGGEPPRGAPLRGAGRGSVARVAGRRPDRLGRSHDARRDGGSRPLPAARLHGRRRRGRGVRQGRPLPRPRLSRWARHRPPRDGRRPRPRSGSHGRCSTTASTSRSAV